jgi:hypothetical protein
VSKGVGLSKPILQPSATPRNRVRRIVAPKEVGSSPVGHLFVTLLFAERTGLPERTHNKPAGRTSPGRVHFSNSTVGRRLRPGISRTVPVGKNFGKSDDLCRIYY